MTVKFTNPHEGPFQANKQKVLAKKITNKKEAAYQTKLLAWWEKRGQVLGDINADLMKYRIPQTIEEARERGCICASEIIEAIEELNEVQLSPNIRKYVILNTVAKDHLASRGGYQKYNPEVAEYILDRVAMGVPIKKICADKALPHWSNFFRWMLDNPDLRTRYALAQDMRHMVYEDELMDIIDTPQMGVQVMHRGDGTVDIVSADMIAHRKMRAEYRKWILAHAYPHRYGDKDNNVSDDGKTQMQITGGLPDEMPNPEPEIPDPETGKLPSAMTEDEFKQFCARIGVDPQIMMNQLLEDELKRQKLKAKAAIANVAKGKADTAVIVSGGVPGTQGGLDDTPAPDAPPQAAPQAPNVGAI
jgi:hypothetical protein